AGTLRVLNAMPEEFRGAAIGPQSMPGWVRLPVDSAASDLDIYIEMDDAIPFDDGLDSFLIQLGEAVGSAMMRARSAQEEALAAADRDRLLMGAPVGTAVFVGDDLIVKWAKPGLL
ncbi:MAG: hypothetical protein WKG03_12565, partial [Telluria sp.]